ncbi:MAG: hypothetical protein PF904_17785 [Kiritimatiellae bacterium]|jgi:hypothetical protein|nr:hypothetical protein [Kiritimatiellia bacterium]
MKTTTSLICGLLLVSNISAQIFGSQAEWNTRVQASRQASIYRNGWNNAVKLSNAGRKISKIPSQSGALNTRSLKVGSEGRLDCWYGRVEYVLNPTNCIISYASKEHFVLDGYKTKDLVDGMNVVLVDRVKVSGTKTIKLANGGTRKLFVLAFQSTELKKQDAVPALSPEGLTHTEAIMAQLIALKATKGVAVLNVQEVDGEALVQISFRESWIGFNIAYYPTQEAPWEALGRVGIIIPACWQQKKFEPKRALMYHMPIQEAKTLPAFINDLFVKFFKRPPNYKLECHIETF